MFVYEGLQYQAAEVGVGQGPIQPGSLKQADLVDPTTLELTPAGQKAAVLWFMNASPQFTGSIRSQNGQWVNEPAMDPEADAFSWLASSQPGAGTVLEQIKTKASGWVVLVDAVTLAHKLEGAPLDLAYVVVRNTEMAKSLIASADKGGQVLGILPDSAFAGAITGPSAEKKAEFSIVTPLVGAGIGFLVAGPTGALVGAGVGAGVEYYRTHQKTA